jgi:hypothetical protein
MSTLLGGTALGRSDGEAGAEAFFFDPFLLGDLPSPDPVDFDPTDFFDPADFFDLELLELAPSPESLNFFSFFFPFFFVFGGARGGKSCADLFL